MDMGTGGKGREEGKTKREGLNIYPMPWQPERRHLTMNNYIY